MLPSAAATGGCTHVVVSTCAMMISVLLRLLKGSCQPEKADTSVTSCDCGATCAGLIQGRIRLREWHVLARVRMACAADTTLAWAAESWMALPMVTGLWWSCLYNDR